MRITFILFLLVSTMFLGCNQKSKSKDYVTIATLKGPSSMGMIKLIDSLSQVSDNRIKVEILNEPIQVRKMMIDGTADFAILPTTMAAILYNRGIDYKLIAIPVWGTLYLFGTDSTITQWDMLRGKTINLMGKGMTPDVLFKHLLIENGIDPEVDVRLDYRFPTHIDLANAVAAGQASLGVISEPLVSLVMERNSHVKALFDLNAEWQKIMDMPIAQTAFMAKGELINSNKELVDRILKSYEHSTQWVNQNPDSAAQLIVKYNILPNVAVAKNSIPRSNLNFVRASTIQNEIQSYLNVFYHMNPDIVGGRLPNENFYQ